MRTSKTGPWLLGTAFLAILVLAGAWLFLVSPAMTQAADAREQAVNEQARIDQMRLQLKALQDDYANLDQYKSDLAALEVQIPTSADLAGLNRQLSELAATAGIFVSSVSISPSLSLSDLAAAAAAKEAATASSAGTTAGTGTATGTTAETGTTAGTGTAAGGTAGTGTATGTASSGVPTGFFAVPIQLSIVGTYESTLTFIQMLQTGNPRLLLITSLDLQAQGASAAQAGRPAMAAGDPATTVSAYAFVLKGADAQSGTDATSGTANGATSGASPTPQPLPTPAAGQANPFAPLN